MDVRTREVEDIFYKFGRIRDIDVKFPSRPPAFAFVDFEDVRDAEDAIRDRDGYEYDGARLRVEFANGGRRDSTRETARGATRYPRNIRGTGDFTVEVSNLPARVSWQDLKDFMRKAGDVVFTEVDGRGGGVVEYSNKRDMNYAVEKLDDSEYRGRSENTYVRVRMAGSRGRGDTKSKSRSRSRSRSYTTRRASGKKRSRSRSKEKDREDEEREKKVRRSASREKEEKQARVEEKEEEEKEEGVDRDETAASMKNQEEEAEPIEATVETKDEKQEEKEENEAMDQEECVVERAADE